MPKENQTKIGHIKLPTNLKQVDVDNMSSKQFGCVFFLTPAQFSLNGSGNKNNNPHFSLCVLKEKN